MQIGLSIIDKGKKKDTIYKLLVQNPRDFNDLKAIIGKNIKYAELVPSVGIKIVSSNKDEVFNKVINPLLSNDAQFVNPQTQQAINMNDIYSFFGDSNIDTKISNEPKTLDNISSDNDFVTKDIKKKTTSESQALNRSLSKYLGLAMQYLMGKIDAAPNKETVTINGKKIPIRFPDRKKMLELLRAVDSGRNELYGGTLTGSNPILVIMQNPNATYVATVDDWENIFNRRVNPNAEEIWIKATYGKVNAKKKEKFYPNKMNDFQKHGMNKVLGASKSIDDTMHFIPVYDISDTTLIDGKEDVFNTEVGLSSNIYGDANDLAIKQAKNVKYQGKDYDSDSENIQSIQSKDSMKLVPIMIKNGVNFLKSENLNYLLPQDTSKVKLTDIINRLIVYQLVRNKIVDGSKYADESNIENILNKEANNSEVVNFTNAAILFIKYLLRFPISYPDLYDVDLDKKNYKTLFYTIQQTCNILLGRHFGLNGVMNVEESINSDEQLLSQIPTPSLKTIMNFFKPLIDKEKEESNEIQKENTQIKEQFFNIFNKLKK